MRDSEVGTIVCGVSGSLGSRAAGELAAALSHRLRLRLVLVHVAERHVPGEVILESAARELGAGEVRLVDGPVVEALARVAAEEGADLIVVGSRPFGSLNRHLRCTLAHDLEAATSVPIVIAPPVSRRRSRRRLGFAPTPVPR
jgi:nucleotide-binding universal stress UspA family protein